MTSQIAKVFLSGLSILIGIVSVGTRFWWSYPFELFSNFKVYYFLLSVVVTIVCVLCQKKGLRIKLLLYCSLFLVAFNSIGIIPWYLPHISSASEDSIRVLTFNINTQNDRWNAIADAVITIKPDIAAIVESSVESKEELSQRLSDRLPFIYRTSGGGLTIFSRFPLVSPQTKVFNNGSILDTFVKINSKTVRLIAAHPIVPIKPELFKRRNAFLAEISSYIPQQKSLILLGDFNLTPWSPYYRQLVNNTNLRNTRIGFGIEPSWVEAATHVHYPKWITTLVKIPIDHIFVSQDFKVVDCHTSKAANSDHRMLWSDLIPSLIYTKHLSIKPYYPVEKRNFASLLSI